MKELPIRFICLVLCLCMTVSLGAPAFAAETETGEAATETAAETTEGATEETTAETEPETTAATETTEETEAEEAETTTETAPEDETVPETTVETEAEETVPETTTETVPETTAETVPETTAETVPETTAETEPEESAALEAALAAAKEFLDTYFPEGNYSDTIAAMTAEQRETCYNAFLAVGDAYDALENEADIDAFDEAYAEILDEINTALAEAETIADSGTCGDSLNWTLSDDGTLTISGTGEMTDFPFDSSSKTVDSPWYSYISSIQKVVIGEGVTSVGNEAFDGATSLTAVELPSTLTKIGEYAFSATGISAVTIPASATSIGDGAFISCTSLADISVESGNTAYTAQDGVLFTKDMATLMCCPAGKSGSYTIPSSVTTVVDYAFVSCSKLTSVTISNGVTSIGIAAFAACEGLQSVTIPDSVTSIGMGAFQVCTGLTSVTIPGSVATIDNYAFYYCTGLTSVTISEGVTSIGEWAFAMCTGLTTVSLPSSITSIDQGAFCDSASLTTVNYSGTKAQAANVAISSDNSPLLYVDWTCSDGDAIVTSPYCGENVTWTYADGTLTISGTGAMYGYDYDETNHIGLAPWREYVTDIQTIVIGEGVTEIGNHSFAGCTNLTSVTMPSTLTAIRWSAFLGCTSLPSIEIPSSVTTIESYAFGGCSSLKTITLPDSLKTINDNAFENCTAMTSATMESTTNISIGSGAFRGCSALNSVTMNCATVSVSDNAFDGCTSMEVHYAGTVAQRINQGGQYVGIGTTGNDVFSGAIWHCSDGLIGSCGSSITWMLVNGELAISGTGAMADNSPWKSYSDQITSVVVASGVTSIAAQAFENCTNITSVWIADTVTTIGDAAFGMCSGLTSVTIPEGVTTLKAHTFGGCQNLETINLPKSVTTIEAEAFAYAGVKTVNYSGTTADKAKISIGSGNTITATEAIWQCTDGQAGTCGDNLTWTLVNGTLTISGTGDMYDFNYSEDEQVGMTPWQTYAASIQKVVISDGVTSIGNHSFAGCTNLTSVSLPSTLKTVGWAAFMGCTKLTSAAIPKGVDTIKGNAFNGCTGLTSITIPDTVTTIGESAFASCSKLTSVTIPSSVTSIGGSAFFCCTGLTSITIPSSVTSIERAAFWGCSGLKSATIPSGVKTIGELAFYGCSSLTSVTIPKSVTSIEGCAFQYCTALTDVYYGGCSEASRSSITDGGANECLTNATWHYSDHTWDSGKITKAATCTATGVKTYTCTDCGVTKTEEIAKIAHNYKDGKCTMCGAADPNAVASTTAVTRLYNPYTGEHLLATSDEEIAILTGSGWSVDGVMCNMPTSGTPIYRLYNPYSGEHLYTMVMSEINNLKAVGWNVDGVMCYSADSSGTPIYRLYNSGAPEISSHLLSTSQAEMDSLVAQGGWKIEGVALYAAK